MGALEKNIFSQDMYSKTGPLYSAAPQAVVSELYPILQTHYGRLVSAEDTEMLKRAGIFCIAGNEISSRNFLVRTKEASYIIKKIPQVGNELKTVRLSLLHKELAASDLPVPAVLPNESRELFTRCDDAFFWLVLEHCEGSYYDGRQMNTLKSIAQAHRRLHEVLNAEIGHRVCTTLFDSVNYFVGDEQALWNHFLKNPEETKRVLTQAYGDMMFENKKTVERAIEYSAFFTKEELPLSLSHHDWHLYNFLVRNNQVSAVLDLESISLSCQGANAAFGALKVLRQYMIFHRADPTAAQKGIRSYVENVCAQQKEGEEMGRLAQKEILRRLFYILRVGFQKGDHTWAHNIPMHLMGLLESEEIFKLI